MNLDEMTIGDAKKLASLFGGATGQSHSLEVGKSYLIRTVTMAYTGRIESITDYDIVLSKAAWIANTGRYSTALSTGVLDEVEPYPGQVIIGRAGLIDAAPWDHPLPWEVK